MFPGRLPVQGGLPILYEGECVGAIGVSGVKSPEDEQIASAGLAALSWKVPGLIELLLQRVQQRNIFRRLRLGHGLQVRVNIRQFLIGDHFVGVGGHLAGGRAHVADQPLRVQPNGRDSRARSATLSRIAVALIAAVAEKQLLAVGGVAGWAISASNAAAEQIAANTKCASSIT